MTNPQIKVRWMNLGRIVENLNSESKVPWWIFTWKKHSWGFLGWATTWGNGRVSQSFWVLENNSVVLKSLFCGIVWCEIQSFRKATCNFVVLTFIEKKTSSTRDRTRDPQIRSQLLYQMSYWGFVVRIFGFFIPKTAQMQYSNGATSKNGGGDRKMWGAQSAPWLR